MAFEIRPIKGCEAISIGREKALIVFAIGHACVAVDTAQAVDLVDAIEKLAHQIETELYGEEPPLLGETPSDEREPT